MLLINRNSLTHRCHCEDPREKRGDVAIQSSPGFAGSLRPYGARDDAFELVVSYLFATFPTIYTARLALMGLTPGFGKEC
jgi:hypothetical protein